MNTSVSEEAKAGHTNETIAIADQANKKFDLRVKKVLEKFRNSKALTGSHGDRLF